MAFFLFAVIYAENVNYFLQGGSALISVPYHNADKWQKFSVVMLAACWISALLFGASAATLSQSHIISLMQQLAVKPLSIVGLLVQILFSTLITALAVILSKPDLFLAAAFVKGFTLSFWLECLILSGNTATAMLFCFLAPSGMISAIALLHFWVRNIQAFRSDITVDFGWCILVQFAIGFGQMLYGSAM